MADDVDLVRSRTDLVALVQQRVALKKAGKSWKGLCPFHDDRNPSFTVNQETGWYKCWSCGAQGDVFDWVMNTERVEFPEALRILAKAAGVELQSRSKKDPSLAEKQEGAMDAALAYFRRQFELSAEAKAYCSGRDLDPGTLERWEIGFAPSVNAALATTLQKAGFSLAEARALFLVDEDSTGGFFDRFRGRLMFPIRDERGRLVAFGGRIIGDGQPKYINSSDTPLYSKSRVLYGMHRAKDAIAKARQAVLVEGYLDVMACHKAGVETAVASLGTSLTEDHARLLKRWCDRVVVLYDADPAGQKATDRAATVLEAGGLDVRVAQMAQGEDPDTLLRRDGPAAVLRAVDGTVSVLEFRVEAAARAHDPGGREFWGEAAKALARARDPIERARQIDVLALRYPFTKDLGTARTALESMVRDLLPTPEVAPRGSRRTARPSVRARRLKMGNAEAAVLRALLADDLRAEAWAACREPRLFYTDEGSRLAASVAEAFPDGPPEGPPSAWLNRLEPVEARAALAGMVVEVPLAPKRELLQVGEVGLRDALARLRERAEDRDRQSATSHAAVDLDALQAYSARLKSRKGGGPVD